MASTLTSKAQKIEILKDKDSFSLIDNSGKTPVTSQYPDLYRCSYSPGYVIAEKEIPSLVNLITGNIIELAETTEYLKINSDTSFLDDKDYIRFQSKKKIGLLKFPEKIILQAEYDEIIPQADNRSFFIVKKGKNYQMYNPITSKFSKPFQIAKSTNLNLDNGLCYLPEKEAFFVMADGNPTVMKTDGTQYTLDKSYNHGVDLNEEGLSMIPCMQNGKYGFIDAFANIVIPFKYEEIKAFDNIYIVKLNGKYGLIDQSTNEIIPCVFDKLVFDKEAFMIGTKEGKTVVFNEGGYLSDQLMIIIENNKYGFATEDQKIKIACDYDAALNFNTSCAAVKKDGKWGFILPTGYKLIDFQFQDAKSFEYFGLAPVKLNKKWGFIDYYGKFVFDPTYDSIQNIEEHTYHLFKDGVIYTLNTDKKITFFSVLTQKENFTDLRDGKSYQSVKIGNQTWMAQNLNFKTDESYYYENKAENGINHGLLYTWKAALTACPAGWHLPTDGDWQILEKTLGMPEEELNSTDYNRGSKQATMLKLGGSSGLDIIMSGFRHGYDNNFYKLDDVCIIWSSTPTNEGFAYTRSFFPNSDIVNRDANTYVKYALPVRCIRD